MPRVLDPGLETDITERLAVVLYHVAHLPKGEFWPEQIVRTETEVIYSVEELRVMPDYASWVRLASLTMQELGLTMGKPTSVVVTDERVPLIVRPVTSRHDEVSAEEAETMYAVAHHEREARRMLEIQGGDSPESLEERRDLLEQGGIHYPPPPDKPRAKKKKGQGLFTWKRLGLPAPRVPGRLVHLPSLDLNRDQGVIEVHRRQVPTVDHTGVDA